MSASTMIHGPLEAFSREQIGTGYSCGVVKISSPDGSVDVTIFTPLASDAKAIADAVNEAWRNKVCKAEAA